MVVMRKLFNNIYKNKAVLITGHTGFKGSWLACWLAQMGAKVIGYALEPATKPNHINLLKLDIVSVIGDIRDSEHLDKVFLIYRPEIVFHMAAQSIVLYSYKHPVETFETNIMGTINVFEACRKTSSVKAIVNVTSDKCYENREWIWGYRENDPVGGFDPYSASKGCSELVTSSYRNSFLNINEYGRSHETLLASARAGNVVGGGDWASNRIIPDIMEAASVNKSVQIRNPRATRPWQHVLEPLSGYLTLGCQLLKGKEEFAEAWNFGPIDDCTLTVEEVVNNIKLYWNKVRYEVKKNPNYLHEANVLKLNCSKANIKLKWKNVWDIKKTFEKTTTWYKTFYEKNKVQTLQDINSYITDAAEQKMLWTQ